MFEDNKSIEAGYGKPPVANQFPKGQSGNPKGRPKGSKNFASIILRAGRERVKIKGATGVRTITKNEAVSTQVCNQAAQGNLRAARMWVELSRNAEQSIEASRPAQEIIHHADHSTRKDFSKRVRQLLSMESIEVETVGERND